MEVIMTNENFEKMLKFVLEKEGGYVNDPNDLGGETNKGITTATYNAYRTRKGLKKQSVKYISDKEVKEIYYNNYFKASGADKIDNPVLASYVFDTAVNMGVSRAISFLKQSNGDIDKFEDLRRKKYDEFVKARPNQKRYLKGWNNRVTDLKNYANKTFNSSSDIHSESKKLFKLKIEKNVYIEDKKTSKNFSDEIRNKYKQMVQSRNRILANRKNSNINYSDGHWVTINGNHVLINS